MLRFANQVPFETSAEHVSGERFATGTSFQFVPGQTVFGSFEKMSHGVRLINRTNASIYATRKNIVARSKP